MKIDAPKLPKQVKAKGDDVINPQNYNFNQKSLSYVIFLLVLRNYCKSTNKFYVFIKTNLIQNFVKD